MTISTPLSGVNQAFKGIVLILVATFLFSSHDALSKYLSGFYPIIMVVWARYVVHTLLMAGIFLPRSGLRVLRTKRPLWQVARALCLLGTSLFFTTSLMFIPLAEATAVNFLAPVLVTALSVPLLGEHVTRGQWIAVIFGFIGVLIIVHPGGDLFTLGGAVAVLLGAVFLLLPAAHAQTRRDRQPHDQQFFRRVVQHVGDERLGAVLLAGAQRVPRLDDASAGGLRDDRALDADPGLPFCRPGAARAVRVLPDHLCRVAGLVVFQPYADADHGGGDYLDLLEWVGGGVATAA